MGEHVEIGMNIPADIRMQNELELLATLSSW